VADTEEKPLHDMDDGVKLDASAPMVTWTHRRKMASVSLQAFIWGSAIAFFIGLIPWPERTLDFIENVYTYFMMGCVGVVFAYMGFTSLPFIGKAK
jgi:uncharacterized membrane protein YoaK (UPF0700 family)